MWQLVTHSTKSTQLLAHQIAKYIEPGMVISLQGSLGVGKTTLTQGLGQALGIKRSISSPTYTIVKQYPIPGQSVTFNHIDAYRLEHGGAESVDIDSFISDDAITIIEWAEFIQEYMPDSYLLLLIESIGETSRKFTLQVHGTEVKYHKFIEQLKMAENIEEACNADE